MGQQQLLLVILVTIIVGIATVVAINIFGTAATESNRDAVRQDLLSAAAQAQAIWSRPEMMGGAGGDFTELDEDILFPRLHIARNSDEDNSNTLAVNDNGRYYLGTVEAESLEITGEPSSGGDNITVTITRQDGTGGAPDYWEFSWEEG